MTLKECVDLWTNGESTGVKDSIEKGRIKLFDFSYPIYDETYKKVFETHFIRQFYMTEIGFETEGLFKFHLETWLNINMPYFNKLFESELLQYDPLTNTKLETTQLKKNDRTGKTDGTSTSTSKQNASGQLTDDNFDRQVESDTPDGRLKLTLNDGEGALEYASNIKENTENNQKQSSSESTGEANDQTTVTNEINEVEDYIENKFGKVGNDSFSKMVKEYRETLLRVEKQIFAEMRKELFMLVY